MSRTVRLSLLICLAGLAAVLSACGGGSGGDVKSLLDKAFSTPLRSANVTLDAQLTLNGVKSLNGPVKLSLQGPYESGGGKTIPKVDWSIAVAAAGQNFTAGFVSTGDNAFVKFQGQSYELGKQAVAKVNQQIQQAAANKKKKGLAQFGIDPRNWLKDAKNEGTGQVAGVDTTHVSATLDVGKFLDDLSTVISKAGTSLPGGGKATALTPKQKAQIQKVVKNPRFDVYVGKSDNVIRRLSADVSFDVPKDQQAKLSGLQSGTLKFSVEFADVGKPQTIAPPTGAKPLSDLTSKLGSLGAALGGATGGGTGTGTGTGTSSSGAPGADKLSKYSQCLQSADPSKPAELQKCAELLK
jgi:hypothetical protein